jgi:hypothetical protein
MKTLLIILTILTSFISLLTFSYYKSSTENFIVKYDSKSGLYKNCIVIKKANSFESTYQFIK